MRNFHAAIALPVLVLLATSVLVDSQLRPGRHDPRINSNNNNEGPAPDNTDANDPGADSSLRKLNFIRKRIDNHNLVVRIEAADERTAGAAAGAAVAAKSHKFAKHLPPGDKLPKKEKAAKKIKKIKKELKKEKHHHNSHKPTTPGPQAPPTTSPPSRMPMLAPTGAPTVALTQEYPKNTPTGTPTFAFSVGEDKIPTEESPDEFRSFGPTSDFPTIGPSTFGPTSGFPTFDTSTFGPTTFSPTTVFPSSSGTEDANNAASLLSLGEETDRNSEETPSGVVDVGDDTDDDTDDDPNRNRGRMKEAEHGSRDRLAATALLLTFGDEADRMSEAASSGAVDVDIGGDETDDETDDDPNRNRDRLKEAEHSSKDRLDALRNSFLSF
mmetsp:Transcript_44658/g.93050  ORF Transcript_44658/g.93050 Transcript_44658/m.93050 type:complete len:383 (+) Transcript_44658:47-1195(+)